MCGCILSSYVSADYHFYLQNSFIAAKLYAECRYTGVILVLFVSSTDGHFNNFHAASLKKCFC